MTTATTGLTDAKLRSLVEEELRFEPRVDDAAIGVGVEDGVVTLTGRVGDFFRKWEAGSAALRVHGVKAVANDIEVRLPGDARRTDSDIARVAAEALTWTASLPPGRISVSVSDGWITLAGEVEWGYQKWSAEETIRHLRGVRGVTNEIFVVSRLRPTEVKSRIEQAFRRRAAIDSRHIRVEVEGGRVTLRGNVRTWVERREAERAAWAAPGVTVVENLIDLTPAIS